MTAVLVGILSMIVLGIPATLAVDRRARPPLLLGTAFLYGSGIVFLVLLALSVLHVPWTVVTVTIAALILGGAPAILPAGAGGIAGAPLKPHWLDLATLLTLIGYAMYATIAPLWEWDFWAIWGLKARIFLERGGIDWHFLESRWNIFAHPDYPLLLPLNLDFLALWNGAWSDRWLGALFVAWGVALLLIVRDMADRESSALPAAVVTLTVASLAVSRYIGLAEGPLIAFGAAGVLFMRRALQSDERAAWLHGAILLGFAANVKNEGMAMLVAIGIALLILRPRAVIRLWPAAALAAPWLILRVTHVLPTDIVTGSALGRALFRLPYTVEILMFLARRLYEPWFWIAVLAGIIIIPRAARRREALVLMVTAVQLVFYIGSYYATPHDARWHVETSWSRLTDQIALPITYVVVLALAKYAAGMEHSPPHAEARPVE